MKIADMRIGSVYAYNRGHGGRTQPVVMLDFGYYLVTRTETDVLIRKSVGKHAKPVRGARGLLAVPAPVEVWDLVREGKDITSLRSIDEIYSRYLIITDNLPEHEDDEVHFSFDEFGDVVVLTPAHVRGLLSDQFANEEMRQRRRDEKYAAQAAEEQRRKEAFEAGQKKAALHDVSVRYSVDKNGRAKVQMSADDFAQLMALVPARKKR